MHRRAVQADHRDVEAPGLPHREGLLLHVDHNDSIGQLARVGQQREAREGDVVQLAGLTGRAGEVIDWAFTEQDRIRAETAKIEKVENWGIKSLTYRIKKNRKGHYVLLNINAPAKAVVELERQLKINEDVLRYLTVRVDEHGGG